jgi:hypothetical protein
MEFVERHCQALEPQLAMDLLMMVVLMVLLLVMLVVLQQLLAPHWLGPKQLLGLWPLT